jgi:O-antigen ligase
MNIFTIAGIAMMVLYMNFYTLNSNLLHLNNAYMVIPAIFCISVFGMILAKSRIELSRNMAPAIILWVLFFVIQAVHMDFSSDTVTFMFRQTMYFMIWIILSQTPEWASKSVKIVAGICFINVIASFMFLAVPKAYKIMVRIYGTAPAGTEGGTLGYKAGLADHYSQNAIYISMALLAFGCMLFSMIGWSRIQFGKPKKKKLLLAAGGFVLSFAGLLLTGKRGPLIFVAFALVIVYLIGNREKITKKTLQLFVIGIALAVIVVIAIGFVPELARTFERMENAGEDNSSQERYAMWELAFRLFKKSPVFGIGTYGFRSQFTINLASEFHAGDANFQALNAHNVYLQVLCENGIIGLVIFLVAVGCMLYQSFKLLLIMKNSEWVSSSVYAAAMFSFGTQIYFLVYCMTGNCIYDIFFAYYSCSVAISHALYLQCRKKSTFLLSEVVNI